MPKNCNYDFSIAVTLVFMCYLQKNCQICDKRKNECFSYPAYCVRFNGLLTAHNDSYERQTAFS